MPRELLIYVLKNSFQKSHVLPRVLKAYFESLEIAF